MTDIKIGDKIRCIYANHTTHIAFISNWLTLGKIYEILYIYSDGLLMSIMLNTGVTGNVYMKYDNEIWFEKVQEDQDKIDFLSILKGY